MVNYKPVSVPLSTLMLDPNNFRFKQPGHTPIIAESRFREEQVQAAVLERVKTDGVGELKRSIAENGFIPVERVVVRALPAGSADDETQYVVVEGNRRTVALKLLQQDYFAGVDLSSAVRDVFSAVPVLVAEDASDDDILAIMGIRHVGGPKEWGGYQSALLVYQMLKNSSLSARDVASRLGLTVNEVNRRHRAFSALQQMMSDEDFAEHVKPEMYPIFHETVGQPAVREWLGWSQGQREFTNNETRHLFFTWLIDGENGPKIRSYTEVRELRLILENEDALTALKDDDQAFSDALAIVRADAKAVRWLPNAKAALTSLNEMGSDTIESLEEKDIEILQKLKSRASWIVKAHALSSEIGDDDD
ncbi:hypothetical protein [Arthrobacter sp. Z4-13]